jgi:hypothetical protein
VVLLLLIVRRTVGDLTCQGNAAAAVVLCHVSPQVLEQRSAKSANHEAYKRLQGEVAALAAVIQDPKALKEQVREDTG